MPSKQTKTRQRNGRERGEVTRAEQPVRSPPLLYEAEFTRISIFLTNLRRIGVACFGQLHYEGNLPCIGKTSVKTLLAQYSTQQRQYLSVMQSLSAKRKSSTANQQQLASCRRYFEQLAVGLLWKFAEQIGNEPALALEETELSLLREVEGYLSAYASKTSFQKGLLVLLTQGFKLIEDTQRWRDLNTTVETWQRPVRWQVLNRECHHYEEHLKKEYGRHLRGWWRQTSNREQVRALISNEPQFKVVKQAIESYDSWRATPVIGGVFRLFRVCWGWNLQKNRALIAYYDAMSLLRDLQKRPEESDVEKIQRRIGNLKTHWQRLSQRSALMHVLNEVMPWLAMIPVEKYMMNVKKCPFVGEFMDVLPTSNDTAIVPQEKASQVQANPFAPLPKKSSNRQTTHKRLEGKAVVFLRSVEEAEKEYWEKFAAGDKGLPAYGKEMISTLDKYYQTAKTSLSLQSPAFWKASLVQSWQQQLITTYGAFKDRIEATQPLLAAKISYDELANATKNTLEMTANREALTKVNVEIEAGLQAQWETIERAKQAIIIKSDGELMQKLAPVYQAWEAQKMAAERQIQSWVNERIEVFAIPERMQALEKEITVSQTKSELAAASYQVYPKRVEVIEAYFGAIENPENRKSNWQQWQENVLNDAVLKSKRKQLKDAYHQYAKKHHPDKMQQDYNDIATQSFQQLGEYLTDIDTYIDEHIVSDIQLCAESPKEFLRRKQAAIAEINLQQDCQFNARELAKNELALNRLGQEIKQMAAEGQQEIKQMAAENQYEIQCLKEMIKVFALENGYSLGENQIGMPPVSSVSSDLSNKSSEVSTEEDILSSPGKRFG